MADAADTGMQRDIRCHASLPPAPHVSLSASHTHLESHEPAGTSAGEVTDRKHKETCVRIPSLSNPVLFESSS